MTTNYAVKKDYIVDNNSNTEIHIKNKNKINQYKKMLESGTAFNGFTPSFFGMAYLKEDN